MRPPKPDAREYCAIGSVKSHACCALQTGFQKEWESLLSVLLDDKAPIGKAMQGLLSPTLPFKNDRPTVICTGHSLGGALATLCALWFKRRQPKSLVYCVTFGSPRVGSSTFQDLYHKEIGLDHHFRVVRKADPVSKVPSSKNYRHVGTEIVEIDKSKVITSSAAVEEIAITAECLRDLSILFRTGDHSLTAYVKWLFGRSFAPHLCTPFKDGPVQLIRYA